MHKFILSIALATTSATAIASAASAFPYVGYTTTSEKVSYADLNLASSDGASRMLSRIHAAAKHVCGPEPEAVEFTEMRDFRACLTKSQSDAVQHLGAPMVTAAYTGRGEQQLAMAQVSH